MVYFVLEPIKTVLGPVYLIKIRKPDPTRPELGDVDLRTDFASLKEKFLNHPNFKLIDRTAYQMIELTDSEFNVRLYFASIPLSQDLGLNLKSPVKI